MDRLDERLNGRLNEGFRKIRDYAAAVQQLSKGLQQPRRAARAAASQAQALVASTLATARGRLGGSIVPGKPYAQLTLKNGGKTQNRFMLEQIERSGLFDASFYRASMTGSGISAVVDYLRYGAGEGRDPHPLFSGHYYLTRNPDVARAGINPFAHYIQCGAAEGRDPNPLFDTAYYLAQAPDAAKAGVNPLAHYIQHGAFEGHEPHPLFDTSYYLAKNPDVARSGVNPLAHYLHCGAAECRSPNRLFDAAYYLDMYPHVRASGTHPLIHYLLSGCLEGCNPHPLFHTSFYLAQNPDVARAGTNPLAHYLHRGGLEGRDPNPLFDTAFYLRQNPDAVAHSVNPLAHYLAKPVCGSAGPHPLFDVGHYLNEHPQISGKSINPLAHFLTQCAGHGCSPTPLFDPMHYRRQIDGAVLGGQNEFIHYLRTALETRLDPNPLFDSAYYLANHPEILVRGINPLVHFVTEGSAARARPHPLFDTTFYVEKYGFLLQHGVNPLVDFLVRGWQEGRDPNPSFSCAFYLDRNPDVAASRMNPLSHYVQHGVREKRQAGTALHPEVTAQLTPQDTTVLRMRRVGTCPAIAGTAATADGGPYILCVSHVTPLPPRAGNEYRIYRLLRWLQASGFKVILVLAPLHNDRVSDQQVLDLAAELSGVIVCERTGSVTYRMAVGEELVQALEGDVVHSFAGILGEETNAEPHSPLSFDRRFCHDVLIHLVSRLEKRLGPCAVMAEYVFMSRMLPLLSKQALKIIDTHDLFSLKAAKVVQFGVHEELLLQPEDERKRLQRADLVLAIQDLERQEVRRMCPGLDVITIGVDFDAATQVHAAKGNKILYIGSNNPMNATGLRDFLRFAWPWIVRDVPDAQLWVAGSVAHTVTSDDENVQLLGPVEHLAPLYQQARVVINPAVAGTGLKIKTIEALCQFRPLVSWPNGVDGVSEELAAHCYTASDWYEFYQQTVRALRTAELEPFTSAQRAHIKESLSPQVVYAPLRDKLSAFFAAAVRS